MPRISADLPDPVGPQLTTRSPRPTQMVMSVRTWTWPYHLLAPGHFDHTGLAAAICNQNAGQYPAKKAILVTVFHRKCMIKIIFRRKLSFFMAYRR
jgi:hypothetical protein